MIGSLPHQNGNTPNPPQAETSSPDDNSPPDLLEICGAGALALIAALAVVASAAAFGESYHALYDWALHHGESGVWARLWPLQVDVFLAMGELVLFVALIYGWGAWFVLFGSASAAAGLAASVAGNVGHVTARADRLTAAVPPLAAAVTLALGLAVLKRVVSPPRARGVPLDPAADPVAHHAAGRYADELAAGKVPGVRRLRRELHIGSDRARRVHTHLDQVAGQ